MKTLYILTNCYNKIESLIHPLIGDEINIEVITNIEELLFYSKKFTKEDILFSFSHSVIVPKDILDKVSIAINVHPAPPAFPGRDAPHFALYNGINQFGATLHKMTEKVDSGDIFDVELFSYNVEVSALELARMANQSAYKLIYRNLPKLIKGIQLTPLPVKWGDIRSTRKMFHEMCILDVSMSKEEFDKRIRIFNVPGYQNIKLNIHGHWFVYKAE